MSLVWLGHPLLAGLSPDALRGLDRHARESVLSPGQSVLREGESGQRLFLVAAGRVRVFKRRGDLETELARIGPGGFFGELSLLDPEDRSADVATLEETRLVLLPKVAWELLADRYLPDYARFLENLSRELAVRLRQAGDRIAVGR